MIKLDVAMPPWSAILRGISEEGKLLLTLLLVVELIIALVIIFRIKKK